MKKKSFIGLSFLIATVCFGQTIPDSALYFGQAPPGDSAIIFAPGIISLPSRYNQLSTFSPSGDEFCFSVSDNNWSICNIWHTQFENGKWSTPSVASFNITNDSWDPFYSPDGNNLYYCNSGKIWKLSKNNNNWTNPTELNSVINFSLPEWSPTVSLINTIYFYSGASHGIYLSREVEGSYHQVEKVQSPINDYDDHEPFIAPDESYLIFLSNNRPDGIGQGDLYISYKTNNGWTNPKNLGAKINSSAIESSPKITPDNKYLLFTRRAQIQTNQPSMIYWVKANFIDSLKRTNFVPYLKNQIKSRSDSVGHSFDFQIPDSTFIDDDGNNTLTYSATLSDGNPLPAWLSFDSATRTFSGTPTAAATISIKVTATDTANATVSCTFNIISVLTGVDEGENRIPKDFNLDQNYPNPFNPTTVIGYQLSINSNVKLTIYNLLGENIKTLQKGFQNAGEHSVTWDGMDDKSTPVSSGMYFYRLEAGNSALQKKMLLLR
ncbi:MAG: putative Ig domain-containing protein [Bacteroidota bacterium]|jgi:hypothetical protein